jgi:DNA-binding NarL/FixJ family response regulator
MAMHYAMCPATPPASWHGRSSRRGLPSSVPAEREGCSEIVVLALLVTKLDEVITHLLVRRKYYSAAPMAGWRGTTLVTEVTIMIRVVVADDHEMFREMLRLALPRSGKIEVVGEAADGQELKLVVDRLRPDVVLLDYKMPYVRDFTALVQQIRGNDDLEVVVLSGFGSEEIAARAAEGGAKGYVLKATRLSAVADAVQTVASGGIWIDPTLPRKIFTIFQRQSTRDATSSENGLAGLTRRELEVLASVAQGISNQEIGKKLCISEQTVKTHLTRIFAKLEVKNRLAAVLAFQTRSKGIDRVISS